MAGSSRSPERSPDRATPLRSEGKGAGKGPPLCADRGQSVGGGYRTPLKMNKGFGEQLPPGYELHGSSISSATGDGGGRDRAYKSPFADKKSAVFGTSSGGRGESCYLSYQEQKGGGPKSANVWRGAYGGDDPYNLAAYGLKGVGGGHDRDTKVDISKLKRPRETSPYLCGRTRLRLRHEFNSHNLDVVELFARYDTDETGQLEPDELGLMLSDINGRPIPEEELNYVLSVADLNQDGDISTSELVIGLRSWYAMKHMPRLAQIEIRRVMPANHSTMPSPDALRGLMIIINESQPVSPEEADYVHKILQVLGANEEHCTVTQLKGAIADWLLNIEKDPAPFQIPGHKAAKDKDAKKEVSGLFNPTKKLQEMKGKKAMTLYGVAAMLFIVGPFLDLMIVHQWPPPDTCAFPHMGLLLIGTAFSILCFVVAFGVMMFGFWQKDTSLKLFGATGSVVMSLIWLGLEINGIMHVTASTSLRCGFIFWHACQFTWCVVPLLIVLLLFFGFPCFFLCECVRQWRMAKAQLRKRLSSEDGQYDSVAVNMPRENSSTDDVLPEAPESACGPDRVGLLKQFEARNLDLDLLIKKYDADGSGVLEDSELEKLLQDNALGTLKVSKLDVSFVMQIADLDGSGGIDAKEVLYAVRTWFAWSVLPKHLPKVFKRYGFEGGELPPADAWAGMLTELNQGKPIDVEEGQRVRDLALLLGASEDRATTQQLRQAVAAWYLHIGRSANTDETNRLGGARYDNPNATFIEKISNLFENIGLAIEGEVHVSSFTMAVLGTIACVLFCIMPIMDLVVAQFQPAKEHCEYPFLHLTVRVTGVLSMIYIASFGFVVLAQSISVNDAPFARPFAQMVFLFMTLVMAVDLVVGAVQVSSSTEVHCGTIIWNYAHFVYVIAPAFVVMFLCCGFPCLIVDEFSKTAPDHSNGNRH